ncbi:MAG: hypothetical protein IPM16_15765 [Chloroflexi bacterium]|nr:hypothetical protein [Chloroflexota bacterium]
MNAQNHLAAHVLERSRLDRRTNADREFDLNTWDFATPSSDAQFRQHLNPVVRFVAALVAVLAVAGTLSL